MALVIIALIIFGIGTASLVLRTVKQPKPIKIIASMLFVGTWIAAIIWAFGEFSN